MSSIALLGTTLGLGFTSGLNLYATVFVTGLAIRLGWLSLPGSLQGLHVLASPVVLIAAGFMYAVEFLADKIPVVDHVWDVVHTFIRPLGACLLAWRAVAGATIPEPVAVTVILLAGGAALVTHGTKAGGRVAIAAAGGHFAGLGAGASLTEDVLAFSLAPLAIGHPIATLVIVVAALAAMGVLAVRILRRWTSRRRPSNGLSGKCPEQRRTDRPSEDAARPRRELEEETTLTSSSRQAPWRRGSPP